MANVYLIPQVDFSYIAEVAEIAPTDNAVLLTREHKYPTKLFVKRHTATAQGLSALEIINTREDLIKRLNYYGWFSSSVEGLWDCRRFETPNKELDEFFERCANGLRDSLKTYENSRANVYLIHSEDKTYRVVIAETAKEPDAVFLTKEGGYPVQVDWWRSDPKPNQRRAFKWCKNREELLASLNDLGASGHIIDYLWDFCNWEEENRRKQH